MGLVSGDSQAFAALAFINLEVAFAPVDVAVAVQRGQTLLECFERLELRDELRLALDNGELEGINPKVVVLMIDTNNSGAHTGEQIADAINAIGVTVYMQYRKDEAVELYRESLGIIERISGPEHPSVAVMHNNIGVVLTDLEGPAAFRPRWPVVWAVPESHAAACAPFG